MELTYAPAAAQDAELIYALSKDLILRHEDLTAIDTEKVLQWVRRKIGENISQYRCVFRNGEKAGYYRLCPAGDRMELDDLYILPPFRNQGIGSAVIKKCCAETNMPIMLYVFTGNTGAMALYRQLGFRVTEAVGPTRCIMVKEPEVTL